MPPAPAAAENKFLVSLSQNYRSTKRILNVADAVIRNNEQSPLLPLNPLRTENREGEKIRVVEFGGPGRRSPLGRFGNRAAA